MHIYRPCADLADSRNIKSANSARNSGELNAIAHRVWWMRRLQRDDGGKKTGVYGSIVEMVNALKQNIDNAQRESENAREQSRKAQEAMQQAEAASRGAKQNRGHAGGRRC